MLEYRELTKDHIKDIAEIYVASFNSEPWNDKWTIESASHRISQMINCEGFDGLVAYENDRLIGMILGNHEYYYDAMLFQIKEFCIDVNTRGIGAGSKLLEKFVEKLKAKGIERITLLTLRANETEGFYKKHGFKNVEGMILMGKEI